jgi:tetratricopeptide (TPR) repeat protein
MASDDFMLTAEELRLKRRKRRRIVGLVLLLALVLVIGFFGGHPAMNAIKAWQARRHAQRAFTLINKEQWNDARSEAVAAFQLRPIEPQALRAVARFLSRTHQLEALEFWKRLAGKTSLTHEDVRDEAMIAIIAGDMSRADASVHKLIDSHPEPADWLLAAQLSIQKNLRDEAKPYLEKIVADSRTTESEQFGATLLQLVLAGDNQIDRTSALTRLKKLAEGKTATSLDALVVLARNALSVPLEGTGSIPSSQATDATEGVPPKSADLERPPPSTSRQEILDLAHALENHPLAKAQHKLLALDLRVQVDPTQREALISRAIADWKDAEPADVAVLAEWLNGKNEPQKTLDIISRDKALQSHDLFLRYLDALGALGRWNEIKQLLGSEHFPLDPVLQAMYLARCSGRLGEKTAAENNWRRALEAAGGDPRKLMTLAQYAEKNENTEIAEAAYNGAAAVSPKLRVAQDGRLRLAQASYDTKKLHAVLAEMLALWRNDAAIQNDEAYTRLLLLPGAAEEDHTEEIDTIERLAEKLVQQNPASLPHRTLLALARLKQHRPFAALEVYSNIQIVPNAVSPSALAVHAAVLAANDRRDDARHEIEQAPPDKLLPEEQAGTADLR